MAWEKGIRADENIAVRLIASDLDGTLLDGKGRITQETAEAIRKAQNAGVKIVAATGRSWSTAHEIFTDVGLAVDYILLNGAEFRNSDGKVIYQETMDNGTGNEVLEYFLSEKMDVEVITDMGEYATNTDVCRMASEFSEYVSIQKQMPGMLKLFSFSDSQERVESCRKGVQCFQGISVTSSAEWNIEVTAGQAQKGRMLTRAAGYYGIFPEEVIVFGDGYNDETLFCGFRHSRAMENAVPLICSLAEKVIGSNRNNGVAKEINQILGGMKDGII